MRTLTVTTDLEEVIDVRRSRRRGPNSGDASVAIRGGPRSLFYSHLPGAHRTVNERFRGLHEWKLFRDQVPPPDAVQHLPYVPAVMVLVFEERGCEKHAKVSLHMALPPFGFLF